ncbi:10141_t:CDS:2 [Acaulospora colombiana]|uniref:10141_t:CDS:1 n=1 Tax=Acaulospora colombiana TaxID=27376 RepID=A0ACA9KBM1_9GLOM|nr:10141_t:CDS:2 [Acaulospora colombiana]
MYRSSKQTGKENAVSFKTPRQKNVKPAKFNAAKTPFAASVTNSNIKNKTENARNDKAIKFSDASTPTSSIINSSIPSQKTKTPIRALRDITNKTPHAKAVKFAQETSSEKATFSKQQSQRTILSESTPKKFFAAEKTDNKGFDECPDEIESSKEEIFESKLDAKEEDVPDVEYCPPPVEESPYEPSDELKINFEFFKEPPSAYAYEFENIEFKEAPFPVIDSSEYQSGDVLDYYDLYGIDESTKKFDLGNDFEFVTAFDDFQFDLA